jgi:membrane-associated protease RseP (regulator of RpoE activity)
MRISEFSIGFGPAVFQTKRPGGAVRYVLRLLPIGGFVSFPRYLDTSKFTERGMTPPVPQEGAEVTDPDDPNLIENRPPLQQAAVISAGVIANLVLAWACLFTSAATVGVPSLTLGSPLAVSRVLEGSTAAAAGLQSADVLIAIDGRVLLAQPDPLQAASRSIGAATAAHRPFTATVERAGERLLLPIAPPAPQPLTPGGASASSRGGKSILGIELSAQVASRSRMQLPPLRAARTAATEVGDGLSAVLSGLRDVAASLTGAKAEKPAGLQGPLGIARMGAEIASSDASRLLDFASVLSLNLAVVNTLPLPGLDGFMLLVLALEATLGKGALADEVKGGLNVAAFCAFVYAFSAVLCSDLEAMGPSGRALATPIAAAGKAVAAGLPALLLGLTAGQLVLKQAEQSAGSGQRAQKGRQQEGNAFLFPEPRKGPR